MNPQNLIVKDPLVKQDDGTLFIKGTRIPFDTVIYLYNEGATPEEVVDRFSTLNLGDVYLMFGYYLRYRAEVDLYLSEREAGRMAVQQEIEAKSQVAGMRERLLAR